MSQEPTPAKRSAVEDIKEQSHYLRGTIAQELAKDSDHFNEMDKNLIKFHGFYQQDNRDARKDKTRPASGKAYIFMVRCKIPGGKVTAEQYLALDRLTDQYANGTLRITSRQGIQFHGAIKTHLKDLIGGINKSLLTTLGACGDVNRNVMATPVPYVDPVYSALQATADDLARYFAPRSGAYHEIWIDGEKATPDPVDQPEKVEPIYGKVYLPRKFKIGLALTYDNSVDVFAQDLGLLGIVENEKLVGFNVLVGGGMGMTHGNHATFPYLGNAMCFVTPEQARDAAEAVIKVFRDFGNRADRKRARIKYVVHDWGVDKFREVLARYLPFPLVLPREAPVKGFPLYLGWRPQGDGNFFYGVSVENGRIKDAGELKLKTALRTLVERYKPRIRLTPMQDILLCDLPASAQGEIERTLTDHGVKLPGRLSLVRTHSMACPAIPTCGLAIAEAERALPKLIDELEAELSRLGLDKQEIGIRMTGCPNGCVRPYQSDIGVVGRSGDKYTLFVGGNLEGSRLAYPFKDLVPFSDIVATLRPLLAAYKAERQANEGFGDYCQRLGLEKALQK